MTDRRGVAVLAAVVGSIALTGGVKPALAMGRSKSSPDGNLPLPLSSIPDTGPTNGTNGATHRALKTVHFVRHGEGYHNVGLDELEDSPLTSRGWADAEGLRAHLEAMDAMGKPLEVQAVFVSPLTRALETACGAFGGNIIEGEEGEQAGQEQNSNSIKAAAAAGNSASGGKGTQGLGLLMHGQAHSPGKRAEHPAIEVHPGRPFIAVEEVRERMSNHKCDKRRPLANIRAQFPGVDFSNIKHERDVLWEQRHTQAVNEGARGSRYLVAEKTPAVVERGTQFIEWLLERPETHVAVVAHREVLMKTLGTLAADAAPDLQRSLSAGFGHCELRSVVFDELGTPIEVLADTHYPGGAARLYLFPINWAVQKGRHAMGRYWPIKSGRHLGDDGGGDSAGSSA